MSSEASKPQFDVIVIGAGINGAGIARDAAMRGLKVLLLDKGDLSSGTSSWSTRLIHGGLRYLEHGEFGLVRESLREREALLNISPHLVRPLEILVPIYEHARRGVWTVRAGMIAYDLLSFGKALARHRMLSRTETLQRAPGLSSEGLLGAAVYFDAQVEFAERLVVENALSAIEHGATVITYARVNKFILEDDRARGVEYFLGSSPTVREGSEGKPQTATARIVINAAGPWVDHVLSGSGSNSPRLIGGTKGSHLIVAPFPGAPPTAIYVEAETDHRPFFIIPWNRNYLIGTTDIPYDDDLDHVLVDGEELDYLLRETNRVIPKAELTRRHILYTYSGVRPLPFTGDQHAPDITRQHFIREHLLLGNLFSIVGGKLTTYRSLAEQTVDLVFRKLQRKSPACATHREPLPGARGSSPTVREGADLTGRTSNDPSLTVGVLLGAQGADAISNRLLQIYGTRASLILSLLAEDSSLAAVFDAETGAIAAEVVFSFKHELAQTLSDCLLRRTMVGLNSTCGLEAVGAAARIAQQHLGWSETRALQEIDAYRKEISRRFRG